MGLEPLLFCEAVVVNQADNSSTLVFVVSSPRNPSSGIEAYPLNIKHHLPFNMTDFRIIVVGGGIAGLAAVCFPLFDNEVHIKS